MRKRIGGSGGNGAQKDWMHGGRDAQGLGVCCYFVVLGYTKRLKNRLSLFEMFGKLKGYAGGLTRTASNRSISDLVEKLGLGLMYR